MKNTFAKKFTVCALVGVLGFALTACDDSSSAGGDETETSALSCSAEMSSSSRHCEDCKDEAISSSGKSNDPAEVTDDSSDSKGGPSSAGTSTKSSDSNSSGNDTKSSSSAGKEVSSSSEEMKTAWDYLNPDIDYGEFTDERDGQVYKTVKIGGQVWMAENLNYAYTGVPFDNDYYTSDSTSWCYDNDPANCDKYGRLYTWAAAIDSVKLANDIEKPCVCGFYKECHNIEPVQGICPKGWHLPSRSEWDTLFIVVYGASTAGYELKALSGWNGKGNGDDSFGFTAIPSGIRTFSQRFDHVGHYAYFWSSTDADGSSAYGIYLIDYDRSRYEKRIGKDGGYSIRCVKDSD